MKGPTHQWPGRVVEVVIDGVSTSVEFRTPGAEVRKRIARALAPDGCAPAESSRIAPMVAEVIARCAFRPGTWKLHFAPQVDVPNIERMGPEIDALVLLALEVLGKPYERTELGETFEARAKQHGEIGLMRLLSMGDAETLKDGA